MDLHKMETEEEKAIAYLETKKADGKIEIKFKKTIKIFWNLFNLKIFFHLLPKTYKKF